MSQATARYMQGFFRDRTPEKSPRETAKDFANYFHDEHISQLANLRQNETLNVSVLSSRTPLSFMTKRLMLISDTVLLTQYGEEKNLINRWEYRQVLPEDKLEYMVYLRCSDPDELGKWLIDCKDLLLNGDIFYFPDIVQEEEYYVEYAHSSGVRESPPRDLVDAVVNKRQISDIVTRDPVKSSLIKPIARIKLPYVDDVDLGLFSKITLDETVAYQRFRDYFRQQLLELQDIEGDEAYQTKLEILSIRLRSDLKSLNNDFKKIRTKRAFQLSGATIATTAAILVAINGAAFGILPQLLGAGGGGYVFLKAIEDYVLKASDIRNSPYYYLWLLGKA